MGNVENAEANPETTPTQPEEKGTEPEFFEEVGTWVKSIFESNEPTPTPNQDPNPPVNTTPVQNTTTKPTQTLTNSSNTKSTTVQPTNKNVQTPNTDTQPQFKPIEIPDENNNLYGHLTIKVVKGTRLPKNESTMLEIGFASKETDEWIKGKVQKRTEYVKATETPRYNFTYSGDWNFGEYLKIVVYGKGYGKEKPLGTAKIDYYYLRQWYINGKLPSERRVELETKKKNKDKDYGIYITVGYQGISLVPEKELMGVTVADIRVGAQNYINSTKQDIANFGKEVDEFVTDAGNMRRDMTNSLMHEEPEKETFAGKFEKKANKLNPINMLNPF